MIFSNVDIILARLVEHKFMDIIWNKNEYMWLLNNRDFLLNQ